MAEKPDITPEQLAIFRRCTFARRVFAPYPSLWAKKPMADDDLPPPSREDGEWHMSKPFTGEPFDPEQWEFREGGWDHEHCDVCWARVTEGMSYWPNIDPGAGQVNLCEACYPRVMVLLGGFPSAEPNGAADRPRD
jgi:hypothetical protein